MNGIQFSMHTKLTPGMQKRLTATTYNSTREFVIEFIFQGEMIVFILELYLCEYWRVISGKIVRTHI